MTEMTITESASSTSALSAKPAPKKRSRAKKKPPKTFKTAYQILKNNATALQQQDEPDIDNLMTTVEDSIMAYKVCQERINAVQLALDEAFASDSTKNTNVESIDSK